MQTHESGIHSVVTQGNSLSAALTSLGFSDSVDGCGQNHLVARSVVPLTLGEAMNNFACGQMENRVAIDISEEFCSLQPGKKARDLSSYPQITGIDRFAEGIPLPSAAINGFPAERYGSLEKLTSSGPLACPFECTRTGAVSSPPGGVGSSFETMLHDYGGLPFDTSSRLDFSKFLAPPELIGRVVGRTGVPPVEPSGSCLPNEWTMIEQAGLNSNSPGSSRFSNELSLSLATSQPSVLLEQCSELSSSGVTRYSMHDRQIISEHTSCSSRNLSSSFNSCRPVQLPTLLSGSRFVQAMQEILAEIACHALENVEDRVNVSFSSSCIAGRGNTAVDFSDGLDEDHTFMFQNKLLQERDVEAKQKQLLALLQLVDERYSQCLDEIHTVTSAFHAVTELDPNLHARFALPTISFMYKNLRERISSHILAIGIGPHLNEGETREDRLFETRFIQKQWALQQLSKRDHPLWRPQRGLPERSVSVLRAWMFQNFLHPYPKDAEKHLLALKSGLTRNQVSNWFINARVRLWKPMIEEMCAEMNRRKARRNDDDTEGNYRNHMRFDTRRLTMD